ERRRVLAQNAQEPEDRRGRGRVHEREEPARGGVRVDVHPLADHHPHLVPQAIVLVELVQKINGQRNRREDDHQDQEERDEPTPEPGRAGQGDLYSGAFASWSKFPVRPAVAADQTWSRGRIAILAGIQRRPLRLFVSWHVRQILPWPVLYRGSRES